MTGFFKRKIAIIASRFSLELLKVVINYFYFILMSCTSLMSCP